MRQLIHWTKEDHLAMFEELKKFYNENDKNKLSALVVKLKRAMS